MAKKMTTNRPVDKAVEMRRLVKETSPSPREQHAGSKNYSLGAAEQLLYGCLHIAPDLVEGSPRLLL